MSITNRIRQTLRLFILAAVMMMVPLPSRSGLPAVTKAYAADYYGWFEYDPYNSSDNDSQSNSGYRISSKAIWMNAGKTRKLKVYSASGKVKWSSSNKKVAKVSSQGVVTAKRAGKATIKAKCPALSKTVSCTVRVYTQASVKKKLLKLRKKYKDGKRWTNEDNYYFWEADRMNSYGCSALVGIFSDKVFGKKAPIKTHKSFSKIKAGDHVRIGDYHSVVVIEKKGNKLTVVEGNWNRSIHWKRVITKRELKAEGFWVQTRYW